MNRRDFWKTITGAVAAVSLPPLKRNLPARAAWPDQPLGHAVQPATTWHRTVGVFIAIEAAAAGTPALVCLPSPTLSGKTSAKILVDCDVVLGDYLIVGERGILTKATTDAYLKAGWIGRG